MGEFLRAMRNDGLDDRWTDVLYSNGNDTFIARLIQKNNEAGKLHHLGETRKCMVSYLEENPGLIRHPDGLLFWARECEKRADTIPELKCDDEALRKYLVVNESQKFLELWRMSQIQVLRELIRNPTDVFRSESCRGVRRFSKATRVKLKPTLKPILSRKQSVSRLAMSFTQVDPEEISR